MPTESANTRLFPRALAALLALWLNASCPLLHADELPRVLVIGDSVSMGYTPSLRDLLDGVADVRHLGVNAHSSRYARLHLRAWLARHRAALIASPRPVVVFNVGLHDLDNDDRGRTPPDVYRRNLGVIIATLHAALRPARPALFFALTTPIPAGASNRRPGSECAFNRIARRVMAAHGVAVIDLHTPALDNLAAWQLHRNVHFTATGSQGLAAVVAEKILPGL